VQEDEWLSVRDAVAALADLGVSITQSALGRAAEDHLVVTKLPMAVRGRGRRRFQRASLVAFARVMKMDPGPVREQALRDLADANRPGYP
jgi:hypothetical protein